jgi:hypothetical protein
MKLFQLIPNHLHGNLIQQNQYYLLGKYPNLDFFSKHHMADYLNRFKKRHGISMGDFLGDINL